MVIMERRSGFFPYWLVGPFPEVTTIVLAVLWKERPSQNPIRRVGHSVYGGGPCCRPPCYGYHEALRKGQV